MVSISGQATQAAPTTPIPVAARYKKSRRVSPESAGAEVAISAMRPFPLRSHFRRLGGQGPIVRTRDLAPARRPAPYRATGRLGCGILPRPTPERPFVEPDIEEILRSEEHTSELQSLMRTSYAVFCLK